MDDALAQAALDYHRYPTPGKIAVTPTKGMSNQRDLALAYSPGVAVPCLEIQKDPLKAYDYTAKGNLVAVISNGTAVLGLGNIGAVAGKPVMEGKGCLFKKFAGIDVFDIEIDETDPDKLVETIASLEPTFGGINLEDIKAPECFLDRDQAPGADEDPGVPRRPARHGDRGGGGAAQRARGGRQADRGRQAGLLGRRCRRHRLPEHRGRAWACGARTSGSPTARASSTQGRTESMDEQKAQYAQDTARPHAGRASSTGADVFFGLSAAGVLKPEMVAQMAERPIILAMANPDPEIRPEVAKEVRPDCIIATGRSDYPNQVNNVLCFPFIFRGALDVGATTINEEMKLACVRAIAELARADVSDVVAAAYGRQDIQLRAGVPDPAAVRPAPDHHRGAGGGRGGDAERRGDPAARRPQGLPRQSLRALRLHLRHGDAAGVPGGLRPGDQAHRLRRGRGRPRAARGPGGGRREAGAARPGRPAGGDRGQGARISACGSRRAATTRWSASTIASSSDRAAEVYYQLGRRRGLTRDYAAAEMRRNGTLIGAMLVREGRADGMLCGTSGPYASHLRYVAEAIGVREGVRELAAMHLLMLPQQTVFICDTYINPDPTAAQLADIAAARGGGGAPLRARAARGAPVALQLRLGRHALRAQDARRRWR